MSDQNSPVPQEMRQSTDSLPADFIVGIGASAGGLQALEEFFSSLPLNPNAVFVVVQHLSPDFPSMMAEILQKRTALSVSVIEDGASIELNHVYVLPVGFMASLTGQGLVLEECTDRATDYPINHFFLSLARERGDRTIGILLSGTGKDGTDGLKEISRAGGVALVQSKETAQFDAMPTNPISSGLVDEILSPTDLAQVVYDIIHYASAQAAAGAGTDDLILLPRQLAQILDILLTQEGIDFARYKPGTMNRRIIHRFLLSHIAGVEEYIEYLRKTPTEIKNLRQDLLIGSTRFFRNPKMWELLQKDVLPPVIEVLEPDQPLRIWVTACSTGEEAYSMAIAVHEVMDRLKCLHPIKLFATDIDQEALAIASRGSYAPNITKDISPERLALYFDKLGDDFMIKKSIRSQVIFASHDLTKNPGFSHMHLVSCRNMLIYLQPSLQEQVLKLLHFSLIPNGVLVLGPSESLGHVDYAFNVLNLLWKFYQKRHNIQIPMTELNRSRLVQPMLIHRPAKIAQSQYDHLLASVFKLRFGAIATTCVLVNADYQTLHIFLNTAHLLEFAMGEINVNILDIIQPSLKLALSTALHRVVRHKEAVVYNNIQIPEMTDHHVNLRVGFVEESVSTEKNMLVILELEPILTEAVDNNKNVANLTFDPNQDLSQRIRELEYELKQTRENLQTTIEKLETTSEEEQATNEEALASNEELQSTNEELQSVNEELYTVNSENQERIKQLTELSGDMDNLLRSTNIGVVFLDHDLNIRKYTPAAAVVFDLRFNDIARPLSELVSHLDITNLIPLMQQVVEDRVDQEVEATNTKTGDRLLLRILPYHHDDDRIDGIVLTIIIINDLKFTEQALIKAKERAEQAVRAKSTFLASMSHEIRTPINGVMGMLQLLELSELSPEQKSKIQIAEVSANILLNVINDILDYSKIEANQLTIKSNDFDLCEKLDEFIKTFALAAEEKELELILDLVEVEQPLVRGDADRIQQIFTNLINNALKFTTQGEILVRVALQSQGEQMLLTASVKDTGIGIASEDLPLLFTEFTQLDNGATREYGGTGLGLAICKKLCEQMGGSIRVTSELGKGCYFEFTLLLELRPEDYPAPLQCLAPMSVLVLDGNKTYRDVLRRQLTKWGLVVSTASNAAIALDLCDGGGEPPFDVMLLDEQVLATDGDQLNQSLQVTPRYRKMARVMMTPISSTCDRQRLDSFGVLACLCKPISIAELWQTLNQIASEENVADAAGALVTTEVVPEQVQTRAFQTLGFEPGSITAPILFVEDNEMNQFVLHEIAEIFDLNSQFVGDGLACLESLKSAPVDERFAAIVMDCMMPGMDGYETTRRIRAGEAGEENQNIPIIAMTANAMSGDRQECLDAGMDDYLMKPIQISDLLTTLKKWIP